MMVWMIWSLMKRNWMISRIRIHIKTELKILRSASLVFFRSFKRSTGLNDGIVVQKD